MKTKTKWILVAAVPVVVVGSVILKFVDLRPRWYIEWKRNRLSAGPANQRHAAAREQGLQGIQFG